MINSVLFGSGRRRTARSRSISTCVKAALHIVNIDFELH